MPKPEDGPWMGQIEHTLTRVEQYSAEIKQKTEFLALPPSVQEKFDPVLKTCVVHLLAESGREPERMTAAPLRDLVENLPFFLEEDDREDSLKAVEPTLTLLIRHLQEQGLIKNASALLRQLRESIPIMWETHDEMEEADEDLDIFDLLMEGVEGAAQDEDWRLADILSNPLSLMVRVFPELDIKDPNQAMVAMQKFSDYMDWRYSSEDSKWGEVEPPPAMRDVHRRMLEVEAELLNAQNTSQKVDSIHFEEAMGDEALSPLPPGSTARFDNGMLTIRLEAMEPQTEKTYRKASDERWRKLYDLATQLRRLEPWYSLHEEELVFIHLPERVEPVACSIVGMEGDNLAICVYADYRALGMDLFCKEFANMLRPMMALSHQESLICTFGAREELTESERKRIKQLGLSFRGKRNWVYFRAMTPGYVPWDFDADQVELMITVFTQLLDIVRDLRFVHLEESEENPMVIVRRFNADEKAWSTKTEPFPNVTVLTPSYTIVDELMLSRFRKLPCNGTDLEIDAFYLPVPIAEEEDTVPACPLMLFIIEHEEGLILEHGVVDENESLVALLLKHLAQYCEDFARPKRILIRDRYLLGFLQHFCERVGIELVIDQEMLRVCELLDHMEKQMFL